MSRTQVPPIKSLTIPRLELQAAVMGSRLARRIKKEHSLEINKTFFWSDSRIVLCWLRSETKRFKTFIAHRVREIQENSSISDWHWVPSSMNVADEATRSTKKTNLNIEDSWFQGPKFLFLSEELWPKSDKMYHAFLPKKLRN
ncbi:uncharacterized protein [Leptinotarsa decemlineata]|uniref:uncharacterized protein n=1 Tax=Leptinotarsa decemlineata TaxID=7539 RepID=UPI003D309E1F